MPTIIEYSIVMDLLTRQGLKSLYHNSGAFGFLPDVVTISRGWIGPADPSIRESVRSIVRQIPVPCEQRMSEWMVRLWQEQLTGPIWILPRSHWAYELEFGSWEWLPDVLRQIGVDPLKLSPLNNGAALEFANHEQNEMLFFVQQLLMRLAGSDFQAIFCGNRTICTIHHRAQLWWTTIDPFIMQLLDSMASTEINDVT